MIEIKNISKRYGSNNVLCNISFSINAGECIGIVGANGSGKTTLLSIISGLLSANSGEILLDGKIISGSSKELSKYISYVPQENPLINELSAFDNLRLWFGGNKKELNAELEKGILKQLGLSEFKNKAVSKMSGGMKKRLSIGIALLEHPQLLIMDEPSAALDLEGKYQIKEYMKYYTSRLNGSILVVSHDQNELAICNKLYLLKNRTFHEIKTGLSDEALIKLLK